MELVKENAGRGVLVTDTMLKLSSLENAETLELRLENGAAILTKKHMTVTDLLKTVEALDRTAGELIATLVNSCGTCDACDLECLLQNQAKRIDIPEDLAEVLGNHGVCFDTLRDLMDEEVVVYGG